MDTTTNKSTNNDSWAPGIPEIMIPHLSLLAHIVQHIGIKAFSLDSVRVMQSLVNRARERSLTDRQVTLTYDLAHQVKVRIEKQKGLKAQPVSEEGNEVLTPNQIKKMEIDRLVRKGVFYPYPSSRFNHFDTNGQKWWDPFPFQLQGSTEIRPSGPYAMDTRGSSHASPPRPAKDIPPPCDEKPILHPSLCGILYDKANSHQSRYEYLLEQSRAQGNVPSDCRTRSQDGSLCDTRDAKIAGKVARAEGTEDQVNVKVDSGLDALLAGI